MNKTALALASALLLLAACTSSSKNEGTAGGAGSSGFGAGGPSTPGTQSDLVANIGDRVFFATDSSTVSGDGQATLGRQGDWLKQYGNVNVTVEGHCDERGTREYNLALGERRANAAKDYLVSLGIPASRINTVSYGKERPAVPGHDESAWSQNRRAVTVIAQ
ncbi:MAG: peptidoglycan-associated lipoprotein Pal [Alphaproteobacteria bacterium]